MAVVGQAAVQVFPSFKGFKGAVDSEVRGSAKSGGSLFSSAFAGAIGGGIALIGSTIASGLGSAIREGIQGAADLEQSIGAVQSIFKQSAGQMLGWSETAATSVGLTKNEFNELGSLIGAQLKNGGTAMDELGPKTNDLITLGADLSSMFGGSTKEAVEALSSALKGERDPIERYGVSLNQAKIDAEAAALGFEKVGGALSSEAQQAATLSLIMKQTNDAHGNFAKEADTISGKQQRLNALWKDGQTAIAGAFLPALSSIADVALGALPGVLKAGEGMSKAFGEGLAGAVTQAQSVISAVVALFKTGDFTAAIGDALNVEEDSGLVAFLFSVRNAAQQIGPALAAVGSQVGPALAGIGASIGPILASLGPALAQSFAVLGPVLAQVASSFATLAPQISPVAVLLQGIAPVAPVLAQALVQLATAVGGLLSSALAALIPVVSTVAQLFATTLVPLIGQLVTTLLPPLAGIISALAPIFGALVAAIAPLVQTLLATLVPVLSQIITTILPVLGTALTLLGVAFQALAPVITEVIGIVSSIIQALLPVVQVVFQTIADVIGAVMQTIQGIIQVVTGIITGDWDLAFTGLKNIAQGMLNTIVAILKGALNIVVSVVKAAIGIVTTIWNSGFNLYRQVTEAAGRAIGQAIRGLAQLIVNTLRTAWATVTSGVSTAFTTVRTTIDNAIQGAARAVVTGVTSIVSTIRGLPGQAVSALGNLSSSLVGAGGDLVRGFIRGMTGAIAGVARTAANMAAQAVAAAKNALQIKSPSRVFAEIGKQTGAGMILGLDGMQGRVSAAGGALAAASVPGVPQFPGASLSGGAFPFQINVWLGDREITDIVRVEIGSENRRQFESVGG